MISFNGPPSTFCNSATGKRSTFAGIYCTGLNGLITSIDFRNCNAHGTLPGNFSTLTELVTLYLSGNQLLGTLPSEWKNMAALENLDKDTVSVLY